jgi:TRAP-type C4-dicarboxylate transport system substrate-binding protein
VRTATKLHLEKTNTIYLSQVGGPIGGFRFYTKKKIERIDDLKNLKLRGSPAYKSMTIALGAVPLIIAPGETYVALERGVADGLGWGVSGLTQFGFHEVAKFVLDHPFQTVDTAILMNAAAYNKLPADVQTALERIAERLEGESTRRIQKIYDDEDQVLRGHGLTFTKLPKAEEVEFYRRVYDTGWSDILKVDAENGAKLKQLGYKPTS